MTATNPKREAAFQENVAALASNLTIGPPVMWQRRAEVAEAALGRIGGVLFMHSHADTCAVELSPDAGYECNCWRAGIYAALGVKP
jgi:hypothetical protein